MPKRVLIFFPHNAYPPRTGAHRLLPEFIAAFHAEGCEVQVASTTMTTDMPWTAESICGIESDWGAKVSVFRADWREMKFIGATGRLLEMQGRKPALNSPVHSPPRMRKWFAGLARDFRPDIVLMNYAQWDGLLHSRAFRNVTRAIYTHDLQTLNEKLFTTLKSRLPAYPAQVDEIDAALLGEGYIASLGLSADAEEYALYDTYDYAVAVSLAEQQQLQSHVGRAKVLRIAPPYSAPDLENSYAKAAVFASGTHALNMIGYAYFVRRVLPLIQKEVPDFSLDITGGLDKQVAGQAPAGIRFTGFAPDLADVYKDAAFAVVPVFRGTGVAVKVIEAMAHGVAPVALAQTVEPDLARHSENSLIAADAEEFAQHVIRLWNDKELRRRLGAQARIDARRYSQEQMARGIQTILSGKS